MVCFWLLVTVYCMFDFGWRICWLVWNDCTCWLGCACSLFGLLFGFVGVGVCACRLVLFWRFVYVDFNGCCEWFFWVLDLYGILTFGFVLVVVLLLSC